LNHIRFTTAQQDTSCRAGKPPDTYIKLEKDQISMVAQPYLPQTPSPSFKQNQNAPRIDLRSIFTSYNIYDHEKERIPRFPE